MASPRLHCLLEEGPIVRTPHRARISDPPGSCTTKGPHQGPTEVSSQIGAAPYERSSGRTAYRNGYRTRTWDTRVGTIELKIPKVTAGTYFPSLLEPRRRAEKALHAVVCEAYVKGISTRKVDDLVKALGIDGISRSEVSRICKSLDEQVRAFLHRPIE